MISSQQLNTRIEKAPKPAAPNTQFKNKGLIAIQSRLSLKHSLVQSHPYFAGLFTKAVSVILTRRVEQMVGKPGFVGHPGQQQQR
ncbi:hypothetical protein D3C80_1800390 [compost metagenome]